MKSASTMGVGDRMAVRWPMRRQNSPWGKVIVIGSRGLLQEKGGR
jgi:hypothetical protein